MDELYEHRVRLVATAEAAPMDLFSAADAQTDTLQALGTDRKGGPAAAPADALPVRNAPELAGRPVPGRSSEQASFQVPAGASGLDAAQSTTVLEGELASVQELGFAFRRAASRLTEMCGARYLEEHEATCRDAGRMKG